MEQKLTKIFQKAKYESEPNLAGNLWNTIITREKRSTKIKLWVFASFGLASLVAIIPVFEVLLKDLARSGFYEYFSLIFSDGSSVLSYWKEFTLSLAESLPVESMIFTLSLVFVFLLSLRFAMKQINNNYLGKSYGTV